MAARRLVSLFAMWLCVLAGCVLLGAPRAQARIVHVFSGSFGSAGSGSGQFKEPIGVAVNDATHDVYVVDSANNRVQEFNSTGSTVIGELDGSGSPTGVFSGPTQIAVDNSGSPLDPSAGDVYVADSGHGVIDKFSASGAYEGQLTGTCEKEKESPPCPKSTFIPFATANYPGGGIVGVAVAPSGVVWVMEKEGSIDNFSDGQPNQFTATRTTFFGGFIHPGFAVDGEENLYMSPGSIAKITSSGKTLISPFDRLEEPSGQTVESASVAIDATHEEAYVGSPFAISRANLDGEQQELFGSGDLTESRGVAVDPGSRTVYATDRLANKVAVFVAVTLPTVSIEQPSEQTPRSVTLKGTVNPEGGPVSSCVFEYATAEEYEGTKAYGHSVPCSPASLGTGTVLVPVSAHLSGLTPEGKYHYRLVASNTGGSSPTTDRQLTAGPILGGEFVTQVTASSATLQASVDPNGDDTHYYFEYGPSVSYGSYVPLAPPGADIGAVPGVQAIRLHLQGLQAGLLYHYRLVAVQEGEAFEEPDRTFTTQPLGSNELTLPDGRAWELVSPPNKKGALIEFLPGYSVDLQAANDGSGITYAAFGQIGEDPVGQKAISHVLSVRGPAGWRSQDISLPNSLPPEEEPPSRLLGGGVQYRLFSPDLSSAVVEPEIYTAILSPEVSERTLYVRDNTNDSYTPLLTPANVPAGTKIATQRAHEQISVYAATPDLSHFVLWSPVALTSGSYKQEYYEWSAGELLPIGILPNGKPYEESGASRPMNLAGNASQFGSVQRAMSDDGRWVAWTAGNPYNTATGVPLYVRDMVEGKTVQVGGPQARFQTMNGDGSKVFFLENGDLYVFDTATDTQTDLTANHGAGETSGGVQESVSDVSKDGSYAYFVADGVLAEGAVKGQPNMYVVHEAGGVWSVPSYVATLSSEDEKSWHWWSFGKGTSAPRLSAVSSRVSPDGRYLVFMSERSLTGYDNTDAVSGKPDEEVYLYDATTGHLECVSCDPAGARPVGILDTSGNLLVDRPGVWGSNESSSDHWLAGSIPGWDESALSRSVYQPRYLSDSGRVFFDSPDALVPQATNGLEDVYEYEPPGVGDCTVASVTFSERSGGCVGLVSSGISSAESAFFDASENGDDAFFITSSKLVGEDYDTSYDVYDAHACSSGWSCHSEPVSPPECTSGDSCKPAPSVQPEIFGPAPSATFSGRGNVAVTRRVGVTPRSLTRAQKLARALRACRAMKRGRRTACERQAHRRYGTTTGRAGRANTTGRGGR